MADRPNDPLDPDEDVDAIDDEDAEDAEDEVDDVETVGDEEPEEEDDRPLGHRRGGGAAGFGPAIAGIMHGIDADIFRDPAAVQRMARDTKAVARTADGTVVGIELPGEGVIEAPDPEGKA